MSKTVINLKSFNNNKKKGTPSKRKKNLRWTFKEYSFNKLSNNAKHIIYQQNACYCFICTKTNEADKSNKLFTAELFAGLSI